MKAPAKTSGPRWEQLTDEQRGSVSRLFETLDRIARKYALIARQGRA